MAEKNSDIFELSGKPASESNNFFLEESLHSFDTVKFRDGVRRLNDYDSNILKDGAYREISDDALKLEYKISKTEKVIKRIESEINACKEIQDFGKMQDLQAKLIALKEEYKNLLISYNERTLSAKIFGSVSEIYSKTIGTPVSFLNSFSKKLYNLLISKLPAKITSVIKIKNSLFVLESINKSVDALITLNTPYGENIDKYREISKYIIKANSIQAEISRAIKKN